MDHRQKSLTALEAAKELLADPDSTGEDEVDVMIEVHHSVIHALVYIGDAVTEVQEELRKANL